MCLPNDKYWMFRYVSENLNHVIVKKQQGSPNGCDQLHATSTKEIPFEIKTLYLINIQ